MIFRNFLWLSFYNNIKIYNFFCNKNIYETLSSQFLEERERERRERRTMASVGWMRKQMI